MIYKFFRPLIFTIPPEVAHSFAIGFLNLNLIPAKKKFSADILKQDVAGLKFHNPVGLAAGFSKCADGIENLAKFGFSHLETGTVTPKAQSGNAKPRIFRLPKNEAIINRLGFNNLGKEVYLKNFQKAKKVSDVIYGINIGKNKDQTDFIADYLELLEYFYEYADYLTINISSPNTPNLRDIQKAENLQKLLELIMQKRAGLVKTHKIKKPIFLKLSPDDKAENLQDICDIALTQKIDALIISNTTIERPDYLEMKFKNEMGGLSGKPLLEKSTKILGEIYKETSGKIPLIGVGGISSAEDAYAKIKNGASLIQFYSALIYQGFGLANKINSDLAIMLRDDNFSNIQEAVGSNIDS